MIFMTISIYDKISDCVEPIFRAMLYIHFQIIKTSQEILGVNINSALIRNLLLTITLLFIYFYIEKEMRGVNMMDSSYVLR